MASLPLQGAFSEAESHTSFLDALNEWRAANRTAKGESDTPTAPSPGQPPPSPPPGTRLAQQYRVSRIPGPLPSQGVDGAGVQTEPRPPSSRPESAGRQLSYFDRLVLSSASKNAGQAASGLPSPPQLLPAGTGAVGLPGQLPLVRTGSGAAQGLQQLGQQGQHAAAGLQVGLGVMPVGASPSALSPSNRWQPQSSSSAADMMGQVRASRAVLPPLLGSGPQQPVNEPQQQQPQVNL